MSEQNQEPSKSDEELVSINLDSRQSSYLQALGLSTLLDKGFGPNSPRYWHFAVAAVGLIMLGAACSTAFNRRQLTETVIPPAQIQASAKNWASHFALNLSEELNVSHNRKCPVGLGSYERILPVAWSATSESQLVDMIFEVSHLEGSEGLNRPLKSDGSTLAHLFVQKDVGMGVFQVFVDAGGRLDAQKTGGKIGVLGKGDTALMKAIRNGRLECAKNLIATFTHEQLGTKKTYKGKDVISLLSEKIQRTEKQLSKIDSRSIKGNVRANSWILKRDKLKKLLLSVALYQQT